MDDPADLTAWVSQRDEAAFRRLVERHSGLVASVCRRQLSGPEAADEAAQAVFIVLAKRAGQIADPQRLSSWIYGVAVKVCQGIRSTDARRARLVHRAAKTFPQWTSENDRVESSWSDLRPHLDEAISSLNAAQREAVVGHYLSGDSHALVAVRLGISEDSARKRCSYALAKLQDWFKKRGLVFGAAALAAGLAKESAAVEPALINACAHAALNPAAATGAAAMANGMAMVGAGKQIALGLGLASLLAGTAVVATNYDLLGKNRKTADGDQEKVLLQFNFEDGVQPQELHQGKLTAGPARDGNGFCVEAEEDQNRELCVWLQLRKHLPTKAPLALKYRYFVRDQGTIWLSVGTSGQNYQRSSYATELNRWAEFEIPLADLEGSLDSKRLLAQEEDGIKTVSFYLAPGGGPFYVDDIQVVAMQDHP